jgi:hypothetical protein
MNQLTKRDLFKVKVNIPWDIVGIMKKYPLEVFIGGGFIRSIVAGEKSSDIDLFVSTSIIAEEISEILMSKRAGARKHVSKNAITILSPPRTPIQIITRWMFSTPEAMINSFDFTISQAAVWMEVIPSIETNGESTDAKEVKSIASLISQDFYPDLAAKRLVYTHPNRIEDVGGSLMRVIKFLKRGYNIQVHALAGTIARIISSLDSRKCGDDEMQQATVLAGILREVDPLLIIDGQDFVKEEDIDTYYNEVGV